MQKTQDYKLSNYLAYFRLKQVAFFVAFFLTSVWPLSPRSSGLSSSSTSFSPFIPLLRLYISLRHYNISHNGCHQGVCRL
ncbi:hypothetical protein BB8028_0003g00370 [Beauveria bassiana]|uniref:Uncharacterized protein n=1 Tax=Beauveria bassiana TaxID=176275 RepID=A0A2S7Y5H6_BEABA|nr:hypothetical protein BB8028_0003g00370 [Beauveria bassiana]